MSVDLLKTIDLGDGNFVTPQGRLSFAAHAINGSENDAGQLRFQCSLLIPAKADLKPLKKAMLPIALKELDGDQELAVKAVNQRFLDPCNPPQGGKGAGDEFAGWTLLRMSSKYRPTFVHPNGLVMSVDEAQNEVYSGRWARVSCSPYWFKVQANKGVTLGLQNIQVLAHDDNIGGGKPKADGQFAKVSDEGGSSEPPATPEGDETVDALFD